MPTNYAGSALTYPANIPLPNDGEPAAAAFLNPAWQRLADRSAYMHELLVTRERATPIAVGADHAMTVDEQLIEISGTMPLLTLPDPALSVGRMFVIRTGTIASKIARLVPFAGEAINGKTTGYALNMFRAEYRIFTANGTTWNASGRRYELEGEHVDVRRAEPSGNQASTTVCQVYGSGFKQIFEVRQNGFEISVVGGAWTLHDDGRIEIIVGAGGGAIELFELVIKDAEDPDYDGATTYAASVYTGITGV